MMLNLLSPLDAALVIHCNARTERNWKAAFLPDSRTQILNDPNQFNMVLMYQIFIQNAIQADELPAMKKPKGKSADKKALEQAKIPKDFLEHLAQYDYWITIDDLLIFMEKPSVIPKSYTHGRDTLARLLCVLIDENKLNEKELNEYLAHKIETAETTTLNTNLKLAENTLKGCCREILETYSAIKNNNAEK